MIARPGDFAKGGPAEQVQSSFRKWLVYIYMPTIMYHSPVAIVAACRGSTHDGIKEREGSAAKVLLGLTVLSVLVLSIAGGRSRLGKPLRQLVLASEALLLLPAQSPLKK